MVSGIAHSLIDGTIIVIGTIVVVTILRFICKYYYVRGRVEGMRDEAFAWCEAFDEIRPPNWQSLPMGRMEHDKEAEMEVNKLYVRMFLLAKEAIGNQLAKQRLAALKKEFLEMGMIPPLPEDYKGGI
jgi:hypothetical protein